MDSHLAITLFRFVCRYCQHLNEHREAHRRNVRPLLVSTRCVGCGRLNYLGGIAGMVGDDIPDAVASPAASLAHT